MQLRTHAIVDQQQGNLVMATIRVPVQWHVSTSVQWTYADVSQPLRTFVRVESPDRQAWVEFFPIEMFYWLEPVASPTPVGSRSLGMIHAPGIGVRDAMQRFVISPYRGQKPSLRVGPARPVDPARLAAVFNHAPSQGEALGVRLNYVDNGQPVEEDFYGMLGTGNRVPFTGRQGTWYESHRPLVYVHALGAKNGTLDSMYPLLAFIVGSIHIDAGWETHRQRVYKALQDEFNRLSAQGYAVIDAAGQTSRMISAGNDALLSSMQQQRVAQHARDARLRKDLERSPSSGFSDYLRGSERMKDPYWGESERSYNQRYHWTDGHGNYRSSNDASFNPNVGAGGGVTWQRMEPSR